VLRTPEAGEGVAVRCVAKQDHELSTSIDHEFIRLAQSTLESGEPIEFDMPIRNVHRTAGTMLGSELTRRFGEDGLPDSTIRINLTGSAGQSLGAWLPRGITIRVAGDANDYVGKGLCGGRLILHPQAGSTFAAHENIIIGNVCLYGATGGELFAAGMAGERFCVRNSGATAVVEGVGDHGCEYMTGGRVVILGGTGRNFAAGMSGGYAYVLDEDGVFRSQCNMAMIELGPVEDPEEQRWLRERITLHRDLTGSVRAAEILEDWDHRLAQFVKVTPLEYKRALREMAEAKSGESQLATSGATEDM
jgi:glutamate synthase (NADPH/NADH) large chain